MFLTERRALTISGSIRLRDLWAFLIHRGGIFARNFKNPRAAEPELAAKSLACLGICPDSSAGRFARTISQKSLPTTQNLLSKQCVIRDLLDERCQARFFGHNRRRGT
jgi:hypothetical protein